MSRYQDYVIKDGKFVGKFDEMYQKFDNPWRQNNENIFESLSRLAVAFYVKEYKIKNLLQFGCGLGQTTQFIKKNSEVDILGIDISPTAIKKAKSSFPELNFKVDEVQNIKNYPAFDCYLFSEITWYLLEDKILNNIFSDMSNFLKGKYFIHNLVFYKGQQKYGREYFSNLDQFIEFCPFQLMSKIEVDTPNGAMADVIETSALFKI